MAAWGTVDDSIKFYEINPAVELVAREYFSYLDDSPAKENISVVIGDARIQIERHLKELGSEEFDLLLIDAFSSDAIPMHLLTQECFKLYCDNLSDQGILAIHVSNRYLDLSTIVYNLANELSYSAYLFANEDDDNIRADASSWVLVTRDKELINLIEDENDFESRPEQIPSTIWTDDFGSLTAVMDWSKTTDFGKEKWDELLLYFGFEKEDSEEENSEDEDSEDEDSEDEDSEEENTENES